MFNFRDPISGHSYLIWCAASLSLFFLQLILFPSLVAATTNAANCHTGACGAMALVLAMFIKPFVTAVFLFSLLAPAVRRARDAGVSPWLALFVPLLFVVDYQFFLFVGAGWAFAFSLGAGGGRIPVYALLGLVAMIALSLMPSRDDPFPVRRLGYLGLLLAITVAAVAALGAMGAVSTAGMNIDAMRLVASFRVVEPILLAVCASLLLASAFVARRSTNWVGELTKRGIGPLHELLAELRTLPLRRLVLAAVVIALAATALYYPPGLAWIGLMLFGLPTLVLPTALIYFLPLAAITLLLRGSWQSGAIVGAIAALPFLSWGFTLQQSLQVAAQVQEKTAAMPPDRQIAAYPTTLVLDASGGSVPGLLSANTGITRAVTGKPGNYYAHRKVDVSGWRRLEHDPIATLPSRYLLLRTGRSSKFYNPDSSGRYPPVYDYRFSTPYELVRVTEAGEELIAVHTDIAVPGPTLVPVLSLSGWFQGNVMNGNGDNQMADFLASALANAQPEQTLDLLKLRN